MGKIIGSAYISLDGFFLSGQLDWLPPDAEMNKDALALLDGVDVVLLDTQAYQEMSYYWPTVNNQSSPDEQAFAKKINKVQKLVITETPLETTWKNTTVLNAASDYAEKLIKLAQENENNIVIYGGPGLLQKSIRLGVVNQYHFLVCPIMTGNGMPITGKLDSATILKLGRTKQYDNGVTLLEYST